MDSRKQDWKRFYGATQQSIENRGGLGNAESVVSIYLGASNVS